MKRILFVDDEQQVLDGLQNLLRKQRKLWDMVFALGAEPGLAELAKGPFDVVVSDMRMPGMDGAGLLARVKEMYPSAVRLILSGHAEPDAVQRTLSVAHQYLSKPCDVELLRVVIERACNVQAMVNSDSIRALVGKLDKLPSVPKAYFELTRVLGKADCSVGEIARIIESDSAMSIKMLQLVNSAYFGVGRKTTSISQAINLLGLDLIRGLALSAQVFAAMATVKIDGFSVDDLQRSSLLTGRLAKKLIPDPSRAEEAFTAGMVCDIGQMVLAVGIPDLFGQAVRAAKDSGRPLPETEREVLGTTHCEVGAYLLGVWGIPYSIVEAVAYYHQPSAVAGVAFDVPAVVHVADALVGHLTGRDKELLLDQALLERLGLTPELPRWLDLAKTLCG